MGRPQFDGIGRTIRYPDLVAYHRIGLGRMALGWMVAIRYGLVSPIDRRSHDFLDYIDRARLRAVFRF